jgi:hypothetical protein
MRKILLIAAGFALLPALPASAQPAAPPAAPRLELSEAQRAEIQLAVTRGRALAVIDQAGRITTRDMLQRVPNASEAGIEGWIAQAEGNGVTVTYYTKDGENFVGVYKAQVIGGRLSSPQVYAAGSRVPLTGPAARMAAARAAVQALDNRPCAGPAFNLLVLPPEGDGPVHVYQMSPRMAPNKAPAGGHFRSTVAADGSVTETVPLAGDCSELTLPPTPRGQRPRPLVVNARSSTLPSELHVFLSLWVNRPVVVATGTDQVRLWGVTGDGIAELQQ